MMSDTVVYKLIELFENNAESIQFHNLSVKTNNEDLEVISSYISGILLQLERLKQTESVRMVCQNTMQNTMPEFTFKDEPWHSNQ